MALLLTAHFGMHAARASLSARCSRALSRYAALSAGPKLLASKGDRVVVGSGTTVRTGSIPARAKGIVAAKRTLKLTSDLR